MEANGIWADIKKAFLYGKETREYHKNKYNNQDYYNFIPVFEEENKNWTPDNWIKILKICKAQRVIFTVKHHDGVSLYPSKFATHHTTRDYVQEIVTALRDAHIGVGLYYSLLEWSFGKKGKRFENYVDHNLQPQLREIVNRYKSGLLWADGDWTNTMKEWKTDQFLTWLEAKHPNIIVNSRWGTDFLTSKFVKYKNWYWSSIDRFMPPQNFKYKNWEYVTTIGDSWGYCKNQSRFKTCTQVLALLKQVHDRKGSFIVNLGPQANGNLDKRETHILTLLDLKRSQLDWDNQIVKTMHTISSTIFKNDGFSCDRDN